MAVAFGRNVDVARSLSRSFIQALALNSRRIDIAIVSETEKKHFAKRRYSSVWAQARRQNDGRQEFLFLLWRLNFKRYVKSISFYSTESDESQQ